MLARYRLKPKAGLPPISHKPHSAPSAYVA